MHVGIEKQTLGFNFSPLVVVPALVFSLPVFALSWM